MCSERNKRKSMRMNEGKTKENPKVLRDTTYVQIQNTKQETTENLITSGVDGLLNQTDQNLITYFEIV